MKSHSPFGHQQPCAEQLQQNKRSSAPILNSNNRLSSPPFTLSNQQTRHSSYIQQQQSPSSPPIQRLSIAERFMSPTPPLSDLPTANDPPISDTDDLQPQSSPIVNFTHSTNPTQPHDTLKQSENTNRSSWSPSLHSPPQSKRHSRKPKRLYADQHQTKRTPKSAAALPSYDEHLDPLEKSAVMTTTTTTAKSAPPSHSIYAKGDRQHEKNIPVTTIMNKELPVEGFWYCHRGCLLLCVFFFILVLGFLLFLVWPRVPLLRIEGASVVSPVEIVQTQQGWMENVMFTTSWLVNVTVDNRQNYIPTRLNKVQVIVKDAVTNALVGKGTHNDDNMDWVLMDGISTMSVLVTVNYQARDMSDTTFLDLVHACHRTAADLPATSLPLHFWFTLYMFGFDWLGFTPTIIATPASSGFFCPV